MILTHLCKLVIKTVSMMKWCVFPGSLCTICGAAGDAVSLTQQVVGGSGCSLDQRRREPAGIMVSICGEVLLQWHLGFGVVMRPAAAAAAAAALAMMCIAR